MDEGRGGSDGSDKIEEQINGCGGGADMEEIGEEIGEEMVAEAHLRRVIL